MKSASHLNIGSIGKLVVVASLTAAMGAVATVGFSVNANSSVASNAVSGPETTYDGVKLSIKNYGVTRDLAARQLTISDPFFETADQDYPLASDDETAAALCLLSGGTQLVTYTSGAGEISPSDVLAYAADKIETAAIKLKLDPTEIHATPVLDKVTCSY